MVDSTLESVDPRKRFLYLMDRQMLFGERLVGMGDRCGGLEDV